MIIVNFNTLYRNKQALQIPQISICEVRGDFNLQNIHWIIMKWLSEKDEGGEMIFFSIIVLFVQ